MNEAVNPKVFISYSWSSDQHVENVLNLAKNLTSDGIHVVIDKWDLHEGQDLTNFMESMIQDDTINKVLIICDSRYQDKANNRKGGVGTESQIISPEIYSNLRQERFIPIVVEKNIKGEPCLPTYLKSRLFIDFSSDYNKIAEYEKLIRNIFNRRKDQRPRLGAAPEFIKREGPDFPIGNKKNASAIIGNKIIFHGTKHLVPRGNNWWNELLSTANNRFYLVGKTNKSWVNKSEEQSILLGTALARILLNSGKVKIVSSDNKEIIEETKKFIKTYVLDFFTGKRADIEQALRSGFSYAVTDSTNYNAVVSDSKLVIMPILNTAAFRDESMVLEIDQATAEQPFSNYVGDIERMISTGKLIEEYL